MYVCMYVYMYICIHVYMYILVYVRSCAILKNVALMSYVYICIYAYKYTCIHTLRDFEKCCSLVIIYVYIYIDVYMYICIYVYMYICIFVYRSCAILKNDALLLSWPHTQAGTTTSSYIHKTKSVRVYMSIFKCLYVHISCAILEKMHVSRYFAKMHLSDIFCWKCTYCAKNASVLLLKTILSL